MGVGVVCVQTIFAVFLWSGPLAAATWERYECWNGAMAKLRRVTRPTRSGSSEVCIGQNEAVWLCLLRRARSLFAGDKKNTDSR